MFTCETVHCICNMHKQTNEGWSSPRSIGQIVLRKDCTHHLAADCRLTKNVFSIDNVKNVVNEFCLHHILNEPNITLLATCTIKSWVWVLLDSANNSFCNFSNVQDVERLLCSHIHCDYVGSVACLVNGREGGSGICLHSSRSFMEQGVKAHCQFHQKDWLICVVPPGNISSGMIWEGKAYQSAPPFFPPSSLQPFPSLHPRMRVQTHSMTLSSMHCWAWPISTWRSSTMTSFSSMTHLLLLP